MIIEGADQNSGEQTYVVEPGDELMKISDKFFGTHHYWSEIAKANPQINPNILSAGMVIKIPSLAQVKASKRTIANNRVVNQSRKMDKGPKIVKDRGESLDIENSFRNLRPQRKQIEDQIEEKVIQKRKPASVDVSPSTPVIHKVDSGESFMSISYKYYGTHQKWRELVKANPNVNPSALTIGQEVVVPNPLKEVKQVERIDVVDAEPITVQKDEVFEKKEKNIEKAIGRLRDRRVENEIEQRYEKKLAEIAQKKKKSEKQHERKVKKFKDELENSKRAIASLKEQSEDYARKKVEEIDEIKDDFAKQKQKLLQMVEETNEKIENISVEKDNYYKELKSTKEERDQIEAQRERYKDKWKSSEEKVSLLNQELEKLQKVQISQEQCTASQNLLEKFKKLEEKYFALKEQTQEVNAKSSTFNDLERRFIKLQEDKKDLEFEIVDLREELKKRKEENDKFKKDHPFYIPQVMAYSQEQVLKEKNRILTQRFWIEKNKHFGKCEVKFPDQKKDYKALLSDFVLYLNETYGAKNVLVGQTENKIIFKLPGKVVYGSSTPIVSDKFIPQLETISNYLQKLPVERMHIIGFSKAKEINKGGGKKVSGNRLALHQSIKLQKFFINEFGWSPQKISSGSMGEKKNKFGKSEKYFSVAVTLEKPKERKRSIASLVEKDDALRTIKADILEKLGEPKYTHLEINENGLELHLGRHYLFKGDRSELTDEGVKDYLDQLMNMFSLASDVTFQVLWAPGNLEKNESANIFKALRETENIKNYIVNNHKWAAQRVEIGYLNRQNKLRSGRSFAEDRYNRRIVFRVIPQSITIRELGELSEF
jgi:hypothetical protein